MSVPGRAPGARSGAIIGGGSGYEALRALNSGLERADFSVVVKTRSRMLWNACLTVVAAP